MTIERHTRTFEAHPYQKYLLPICHGLDEPEELPYQLNAIRSFK